MGISTEKRHNRSINDEENNDNDDNDDNDDDDDDDDDNEYENDKPKLLINPITPNPLTT